MPTGTLVEIKFVSWPTHKMGITKMILQETTQIKQLTTRISFIQMSFPNHGGKFLLQECYIMWLFSQIIVQSLKHFTCPHELWAHPERTAMKRRAHGDWTVTNAEMNWISAFRTQTEHKRGRKVNDECKMRGLFGTSQMLSSNSYLGVQVA